MVKLAAARPATCRSLTIPVPAQPRGSPRVESTTCVNSSAVTGTPSSTATRKVRSGPAEPSTPPLVVAYCQRSSNGVGEVAARFDRGLAVGLEVALGPEVRLGTAPS